MCFCSIGIPLILGVIKILKYVQYLVRVSRQNVLLRSHIAQMLYISFLVVDFTISLITFFVSARHDGPTRSATSPAFTNGFLIRGIELMFRETSFAHEMSITFSTRNSDSGEGAWWAHYTFGHTCE